MLRQRNAAAAIFAWNSQRSKAAVFQTLDGIASEFTALLTFYGAFADVLESPRNARKAQRPPVLTSSFTSPQF